MINHQPQYFISFGVSASHLLSASVMSAPAALAFRFSIIAVFLVIACFRCQSLLLLCRLLQPLPSGSQLLLFSLLLLVFVANHCYCYVGSCRPCFQVCLVFINNFCCWGYRCFCCCNLFYFTIIKITNMIIIFTPFQQAILSGDQEIPHKSGEPSHTGWKLILLAIKNKLLTDTIHSTDLGENLPTQVGNQ